jgi:DNA-binding LacI/PurR family transcriptional regulator
MICLNDEVAMTAISALAREGIRVPADVSLVGCDNIPESEYLLPPLTTVDNHVEQQMQSAVALLIKRIESPNTRRVLKLVVPSLVERGSVRQMVA